MIPGSDGAGSLSFETGWSRRFKRNRAKLASGEPAQVGEVVRELSELEAGRGLSAGEKRMLAKARQMLD